MYIIIEILKFGVQKKIPAVKWYGYYFWVLQTTVNRKI